MSFLKRLFGGGASEAPPGDAPPVEYKGYTIRPTPYREDGQYQTCGVVSREIGGELKEHRFVRADRFPDLDSAVNHSLHKGRQLVDEQGERMFG